MQSAKMRSPQGVLPVFQTPFLDNDAIDFSTLQAEIDWLFDRGADGIVMAMVSETLRLSSEERDELAAAACRFAAGRGAVVISVGAESRHTAERHARHAQDAGADAVMAIPPVATAAEADELLRYYEGILQAVSLPVIVQDASGYVGRPMSIEMQARLFENFGPRVMYKPEAPPLGPRLSALREATSGRAAIFEGSGGIALVESFRRGIAGTMPGAEMIEAIAALWRALQAGQTERVNAIAPWIACLISLQTSLDAYLAVEKHLLVRQGVFRSPRVRGPVGYRLDDVTCQEVDRLFDRLMAAVRGQAAPPRST